ncbi:MAG: hypothetical protein FWD43_03680, partial [Coriobacteriia bacterium]|nr:hypothetical protein [Coriobacteriia bacterium]
MDSSSTKRSISLRPFPFIAFQDVPQSDNIIPYNTPVDSFEYILVMLGAVLISNLISQRFPRISTPLIQIALGIVLALLPIFHFNLTLDPELFLLLFIAPLLFEDAKKADKPT